MALPGDAQPVIRGGDDYAAILLTDLITPTVWQPTPPPEGAPPPGAISGVVTVLGDPAVQTVRAYRRSDGALVGETVSAEDGSYTISGLDPNEVHYVVALHGTLEYNAVAADNITPEEPA